MPSRAALERAVETLITDEAPGAIQAAIRAILNHGVGVGLRVLEDGIEALAILRSEGPHTGAPGPNLVLFGRNLDGQGGRDMARADGSAPGLQRIPATVFLRSPAEVELPDASTPGGRDRGGEPINFDQLFRIVRLLEGVGVTMVPVPAAWRAGVTDGEAHETSAPPDAEEKTDPSCLVPAAGGTARAGHAAFRGGPGEEGETNHARD
ncbi:MAG TPA: hypothetical protein VKA46_27885 [Gemmataceae bacterium]|nr:hypothetical protein [Gemmataceae bacterium]